MIDFNVAVVIPAAGKSERFCGECPKQYFNAMGKPLFLYCLEAFIELPYVKKICLVSDRVEYAEQLVDLHSVKQDKVIIASGGSSRHASIKSGLIELKQLDLDLKVVIVHDGARPLVPKDLTEQLICEAALCGAAGATRPLTSTVLRPLGDGSLDASLDRRAHLASETPQAFLFEMLYGAYQKCSLEDLEVGTECLELALKYCGVRAKLIPGPDSLWKVTEKKDCYSAEGCIKELSTRVCILSETENDLVVALRDALQNKVAAVTCHLTGSDEKPETTYNTVICFHEREIDQDSQILVLADVLDIESSGLIIHIVLEGSAEDMVAGSVYDLLRCGRSMLNQYDKLKKGVAMIHFTSPEEETRLIDLVTTLVLSDCHVFSGQTFFI